MTADRWGYGDEMRKQLGMTEAQFDAWLKSLPRPKSLPKK